MAYFAVSRRGFLAGTAALTASAGLLARPVLAAAPPYRFKQGAFDISVFSDGFLTLPGGVFAPDANPQQVADLVTRLGGKAGNVQAQANIPLIRTGNDLILVDIGSGGNFQPSAGKLRANLIAAGVDPASITKVVLTHAHPDHAGGMLLADGTLAFPNASYYVGAAEWDFWMDPDFNKKMPAMMHAFGDGAKRDLGAVKDRVTMLKAGDDIVTGLRAISTFGHTPGHLSLEVSGGGGLIITGDAMANHVVSFENPRWRFGFDANPDLATDSRSKLIDRAATDRIKLLGYHWASPALGFAERQGTAYRFVAAS